MALKVTKIRVLREALVGLGRVSQSHLYLPITRRGYGPSWPFLGTVITCERTVGWSYQTFHWHSRKISTCRRQGL